MSTLRDSLIYAGVGIVCLFLALFFAFDSVSLGIFGFGPVVLRYNPFMELLAFVFVSLGGFLMFRAGQMRPPGSVLKKSLVEQVKSVEGSQ